MALRLMREWMKYLKWILWFVVVVFIAALFFDFGSINQFGRSQGQVAVSVGDEQITYDEFRRQYQSLESRYRQMFGERYNAELARQFNLPQQALDQLINRRILLLEADRMGLLATDTEVQEAILEYPVFKDASGKFVGRERVIEILRQNQMSEKEFSDAVREDVLLEKLNSVLAQTTYLSDGDLESAWREQNEKAKVRYIHLPGTSAAASVTVAESEIEAYFNANSAKFRVGEQRVVDMVLVDINKVRTDIKVDDAEVRSYYDQNIKDYTRGPATTTCPYERPGRVTSSCAPNLTATTTPPRRRRRMPCVGCSPVPTSSPWLPNFPTTSRTPNAAATSATSVAARW